MSSTDLDPALSEAPDRSGRYRPDAIGLCLSGGGYRAMLFHLGVVWRLNELGILPTLARISSVSGGSITAGVLARAWKRLEFDEGGVARAFEREVVAPLKALATRTIDWQATAWGLLPFTSAGEAIASSYRRHLFADTSLRDLPDEPVFVFNASHLKTGKLFRFTKKYVADWTFGRANDPDVPLAVAVAASSAFPPFLSPVRLQLSGLGFIPEPGAAELDTSTAILSDGGVYDNLGLETLWKRCGVILVSDGGGALSAEERPSSFWPFQTYRVLNLIDSQVRALRVRQLIGALADGRRRGAYLGIRTDLASHGVPSVVPVQRDRAVSLAAVKTRLAAIPVALIHRLINWGYLVCDSGLRARVRPETAMAEKLPYPEPF
jgi:NTE family protein